MKNNLIKQLAVTGLAVAAVAGVAVAASAAANSRPDTATGSSLGGPDPAVPSGATPGNSVPTNATPAVPGDAVKATPAPPQITAGMGTKVAPVEPPKEQPLPKDAVKTCKELLAGAAEKPSRSAKVAARLDGDPGTVLVLADSKYWVGCDTAYARQNGAGSLRQPTKNATPSASSDTFAVANNIIPLQGKDYEYHWAAGLLPAGVAGITYTFPDGAKVNAVVKGKYWLMQHRTAKPWGQGADAEQPKIKVALTRANGSVLKTFHLTWGEQTCAQITHGC
jgi:hypothetical protein